MRFLGGLILHTASNAIAILAASYFIAGFLWDGNFVELLVSSAILTAINMFLKPVLKLFLGPLVALTFGLFIIVINAITLYLLDIFVKPLTIQGYTTLLLTTLLFSAISILINFGAKLYKR
ncbi:MAG: phage holin family protein [Patescibacteria group bacterium]